MKSLITAFSLVLLCSPLLGGEVPTGDTSRTVLHAMLSRATSNDVAQVEVICFPERVDTYLALSPDRLENDYWSKTIIKRFQDSKFRAVLLRSLVQSDFQPRAGGPRDLRWGCIFYDNSGNRILSIYLDKFGNGQVDQTQVLSNGKILNLFRKNFDIHEMR